MGGSEKDGILFGDGLAEADVFKNLEFTIKGKTQNVGNCEFLFPRDEVSSLMLQLFWILNALPPVVSSKKLTR